MWRGSVLQMHYSLFFWEVEGIRPWHETMWQFYDFYLHNSLSFNLYLRKPRRLILDSKYEIRNTRFVYAGIRQKRGKLLDPNRNVKGSVWIFRGRDVLYALYPCLKKTYSIYAGTLWFYFVWSNSPLLTRSTEN